VHLFDGDWEENKISRVVCFLCVLNNSGELTGIGDHMNEYPEKTCDIDRLVRHPKLVAAALEGKKTEQRRDGVYAYPNEVFELGGIPFIVTDLKRQKIGDMTEADAQAEGFTSLDMYQSLILNMHKGMSWNGESQVWVHCFKRKPKA